MSLTRCRAWSSHYPGERASHTLPGKGVTQGVSPGATHPYPPSPLSPPFANGEGVGPVGSFTSLQVGGNAEPPWIPGVTRNMTQGDTELLDNVTPDTGVCTGLTTLTSSHHNILALTQHRVLLSSPAIPGERNHVSGLDCP